MCTQRSADDVIQLLSEYPLATVVSCDGPSFGVTSLPLLADISQIGGLVSVTGHIARSDPHVGLLQQSGRSRLFPRAAWLIFAVLAARPQKKAPTWNYASAHFLVDTELFNKPDATHQALHRLVRAMEHSNDNAWKIEELAERYQKLSMPVVGFRADILNTLTMFKLGRGERDAVLEDIVIGLGATGQSALAEWTRSYSRV